MRRKLILLIACVWFMLALPGAACIGSALPAIIQGAQLLGSAIDVADAGQRAYFSRHADMEAQIKAATAVRYARAALLALNSAQAAAQSADDGDLVAAKKSALESYKQMRALFGKLGVLTAAPRAGGADGMGPDSEPVDLPTADELAAYL